MKPTWFISIVILLGSFSASAATPLPQEGRAGFVAAQLVALPGVGLSQERAFRRTGQEVAGGFERVASELEGATARLMVWGEISSAGRSIAQGESSGAR